MECVSGTLYETGKAVAVANPDVTPAQTVATRFLYSCTHVLAADNSRATAEQYNYVHLPQNNSLHLPSYSVPRIVKRFLTAQISRRHTMTSGQCERSAIKCVITFLNCTVLIVVVKTRKVTSDGMQH